MQVKTFEIRDEGTHIPAMGIRLEPGCERDSRVFARAGYGTTAESQRGYVFLCRLAGGVPNGTSDPYFWEGRTMQVAHNYLTEHFDALESGCVVDVEFILGLRTVPKLPES